MESYPQAKQISLLDERTYQAYLAQPGLFFDELNSIKGANQWIVVDEIQRLPQLLNEVHRLIEGKKFRFAMTGSSARKLRRAGVNLLAGRATRKMMYPLTPQEMGHDFNLSQALSIGTLPLVIHAEDPRETLRAYVQMYLKEEIQAEAVVKNLSGFARFLPVAALFHGQILNLSNVARDAEVSRPTVQGFFDILEDTLLAYRLPAYSSKLRVREKRHPKFYWIDPGIVRAARRNLGKAQGDELGALLEGFVFMLLSFQRDTFGEIDQISYWSPAEARKTEVDFLIEKDGEVTAIEVKASQVLRPDHLLGLKAISDLKGLRRRIIVYLGERRLKLPDGVEVLPFADLVTELSERRI